MLEQRCSVPATTTVSLVPTAPVHCLTAIVRQVYCPHRRSRQHRATPPVRACTNITLDESGTGQRCGCYLLGPVAAYQSSDRRAKRPPDPILTTLVPPTLQRVFSGWVRTLTDGLAGMRHTVEIVSTRRIRWCQLFIEAQIQPQENCDNNNTCPFGSPAFLAHVVTCTCEIMLSF